MPSRYHPIEDGLWNDGKLEGTKFEEKGFFAFLCSNSRQRPAGIYRATDAQLAADTELPERRIKAYLIDLANRGLIVRDGAWVFVRNYLKRQPKQERLLAGVESDVRKCDSIEVLTAFGQQYPIFSRWSSDHLETVARRVNGFVPKHVPQSSYRAVTERTLSASPSAPPTLFVQLWQLHPGPKGSKQEALKAFRAVEVPKEALDAMRAQVWHKQDCDRRKVFCAMLPHLCRWIKQRRWEDEVPKPDRRPEAWALLMKASGSSLGAKEKLVSLTGKSGLSDLADEEVEALIVKLSDG